MRLLLFLVLALLTLPVIRFRRTVHAAVQLLHGLERIFGTACRFLVFLFLLHVVTLLSFTFSCLSVLCFLHRVLAGGGAKNQENDTEIG